MLEGKGYFIWVLRACENANADAIATEAAKAGLSHVMIKVADADRIYNYDESLGLDLVPPVVAALKARGIQAWGWQYIYGEKPLLEARKAVQRVNELGLDGFVVNAEVEFKASGMGQVATTYMKELRGSLPNTPIALSTYRFPAYHPSFPYSEFLQYCDINMPQVYWLGAHNSGEQLVYSYRQFQAISPWREFVPTGMACEVAGYPIPTVEEELEFLNQAKSMGLKAANFWSWQHARKLPDLWQAIGDYSWPYEVQEKDIVDLYFEKLNADNALQLVVDLYDIAAVHVTGKRTIQGHEGLVNAFKTMMNDTLPAGNYTMTGKSQSENQFSFTWSATSNEGNVLDGSDIIRLKDGKIAYHYSYYSIS